MIDFSDIHQVRIPKVTFQAPVAGDSLGEVALAAYKICADFYGEQPFQIEDLPVELVWPPEDSLPKYRGMVWARNSSDG